MKALKKPSTAILITVVVVILGTLFGVHRSVNAQTAKIEKLFYNGVVVTDSKTKSTYLQPSIQAQLDARNKGALGLASFGDHYADLKGMTDALRSAQHALAAATTITEKYNANTKIQSVYESLSAALKQRTLTEQEKEAVFGDNGYAKTLDGAQGIIGKSAYNEQVASFMKTLDGFPVNVLKNLAFVKYPGYFGAEGS